MNIIDKKLLGLNPSNDAKTDLLFLMVFNKEPKLRVHSEYPEGLLALIGASNNKDCFIISAFM